MKTHQAVSSLVVALLCSATMSRASGTGDLAASKLPTAAKPAIDAYSYIGYSLIGIFALLAILLACNWAIKRVNEGRRKRELQESFDELLQAYESTREEIGRLLCDAEHDMNLAPDLVKPQAMDLVWQIRKIRDGVINAKLNLSANGPAQLAISKPSDTKLQLQKMYNDCLKLASDIRKLPAELEAKLTLAREELSIHTSGIEALRREAVSLEKEGYHVVFGSLDALEEEVERLGKVLDNREVHPDNIVWKEYAERHENVRKNLAAPKILHEETTELIKRCEEISKNLKADENRLQTTLAAIQKDNPPEVWHASEERYSRIKEHFLFYESLLVAAREKNEISAGLFEEASEFAEEAKAQLDVIKSIHKGIDDLADLLEQARRGYLISFEKSGVLVRQAKLAAKEDGVKLSTIRKSRDLEFRMTEVENLVLRAKQGEMVNWLVFTALMDDISDSSSEVLSLAREEAKAHRKLQERLVVTRSCQEQHI